MNLMLITADDLIAENTAQISDYRAQHILHIHRSQVGARIRLGMVNGNIGVGEVTQIEADRVTLKFLCDTPPPAATALVVVLALPRPQMLKRSLQTLATMGIKHIYLIASARVEKSYWSSPSLQNEEIQRHLTLGLEQAMDTVMPEVHLRQRFKPFVEDELPDLCIAGQSWVAHPGDFPPCPIDKENDHAKLLAIGPEGGFLDYEIDKLVAAGCQPVQLGPRILRVETALPVLISHFYPIY